MTRNAKVGEYIIVNATGEKLLVKKDCVDFVVAEVLESEISWQIYNKDYTLVEDTMKAEDIDLSVDQVFNPPIEGFEFRDDNGDWISGGKLYSIVLSFEFPFHASRDRGEAFVFKQCRPIAKPEPKTRPMTNLEGFQLMPIGTPLYHDGSEYFSNEWSSSYTDMTNGYKYTIIDQAFKELKTIDDIEWKAMEVKE